LLPFLRQTAHLLALSLSTHRARPRDGALVCAGFVLAAATLAFMLSIPAGMARITAETGIPDLVMVLSNSVGTMDEASSQLTPEQIAIVSQLPQVARDADGRPLVAPQFLANTRMTANNGKPSMLMLRGVTDDVWKLFAPGKVHTTGRIRDGARQVLASRTLSNAFPALQQPEFLIQGSEWQLAGQLDTGGTLWESELWTDLSALQAAYNRPGVVSSLWLKLASADQTLALAEAINSDPRLDGVRLWSQLGYYQTRTGTISDVVRLAAAGVAVLLGLGAILVISAMLDIALMHRRSQIATLRALGFDRAALALATLLDVLLLGILSALASAALVWGFLDGASFGASTHDQAVYAVLVVDSGVVMTVLVYSLILGLISTARPLRRLLKGTLVSALQN